VIKMGCDIHIFPEYRKKTGNKRLDNLYNILNNSDWKYLYKSEIIYPEKKWYWPENYYAFWSRNYGLFGILAGVRSCVNPIIPLRGLPSNISKKTKNRYMECKSDYHSETWYYLSELLDINWKKYRVGCKLFKKYLKRLQRFADKNKISYNDVRLVMWFDN